MERTQRPAIGLEAFRLYWAGKGELSVAYWGFGVVGSFIILFLSMLGLFAVTPFAQESSGSVLESSAVRIYFSAVLLVLLAHQVLVGILVWRNAHNTGNPLWSQLAQGVVALGVVFFLYELLIQL